MAAITAAGLWHNPMHQGKLLFKVSRASSQLQAHPYLVKLVGMPLVVLLAVHLHLPFIAQLHTERARAGRMPAGLSLRSGSPVADALQNNAQISTCPR